jgi:hypothetical protein
MSMLEPQLIGVGARHLERLVIALAGTLAIWLGYRLFINMPLGEKGTGKLQLPGGISIFLSRVGPGVFFALFGAGVLAYGLHQAVRIEVSAPPAVTTSDAPAASSARAPDPPALRYSGAQSAQAAPEDRAADRNNVVLLVGTLTRVAETVRGQPPTALPPEQRLDYELALADARVRLLASVWDAAAWGSFAEFQRWIRTGEPDPPPAAIAGGVRAFRGR